MGALSHLRIVEIGSAAATSYCARLFADFGADVQKVEPPAGDPLRRAAPLTPQGHSAWFAFLNFNKSSVVLDQNDASATSRLHELITGCDILLDGRGIDAANCPGIDLDAVKRNNPGLIHLDLAWFGDRGPYADFAATDSTIRALTGLVKLVGPEQGPPMHAPDFQTGILGGLWGFIAAASSVLGRMQDGRGRESHLSLFEASIAVTEYIMFEAFQRGDIMRRIGVNRFWPTFPVGIYETKQGWLGVTTVTPAQWRAFCEMLGLTDLCDDPTLVMGVDRLQRVAEIEGKILPKLKQRTAQEWFAEGLKRKIPIVPVPEIADLIADEEKRARGAIVPITVGDETGFSAGTMQRLTGTPPLHGGRVPDLGEQQARRDAAPRVPAPKPAPTNHLPLEGIRVVDFSMGWAGPICTRTLADLGADVIKIEATQYPDWWRGVDRRPAYVLEQMYEKSVRYCIMNRNKRGITLDLTRPKGLALAKRLLADADLVVDNYSVEVLPKLGLGYEVLSKINPKLVMMSMSAFGAGSVHRDCRAYGSTLEQGSGLPSVVGDAGGPPVMSHTAFGDAVGGLNGAAAVLTALIHAKLTGQGQFIDLAQIECMMPFAAPWIVAHSIDGKQPAKYGNRHPDFVPHGCFRCDGEDNWIVVAVSDDAMWPRLARLLGRDDWAADATLRTAAGRRAIESEIEAAIEAWTSARNADAAMTALQAAGVASGVARLPIDLLDDPQLDARGFIQQVDRAFIGKHPQPSMPFREGDAPFAIRSVPPTLGEHNREILSGMLGLSDAELEELSREGIIGTEMLMEEQLVQEKKRAAG
ncbi:MULTISPECIES: CaiB/BaiF CoA-transferase family protein [unclassified Bradyrhizobium]|uniref:CaiB/BaiF CoA transferase family protein n=1 Tax=unclassified Bradyrhizobium TaxID=2631580 RepID=UPI001BAD89B7|nr:MULTISPECIES: CoA transferase [unclassified Bradyrhizobium]MBR1201965.1 CoA transferase [Bradyrhizobium sp. AUGA SZCCT0124]MBR1311466.1 CoA transferase [Bradyrhizobium sp. AUGA SZCCT0051]MBR1338914.1 CoA transferase [Bradyrhizobium sp. AUGA SZCCT0105]MBR1353488.1 CoA transferase [Bradyrhizobium sp. AUGA SZCCT0045]